MAATSQQRQTGLRQQPLVLLVVVLLFCSAMVTRLVWMQLLEGPVFVSWRTRTHPTGSALADPRSASGSSGTRAGHQQTQLHPFVEPRLVSDSAWPVYGTGSPPVEAQAGLLINAALAALIAITTAPPSL